MPNKLQQAFGNIDIYLFDQVLKGRFDACKNVLDAGCGFGRNLHYFLQNGFSVFGVDQNTEAIKEVQLLAQQLSAINPPSNFTVSTIEDMPFKPHTFDLVICSAVLHFATNHNHFMRMLQACNNVLKPGGYFFARLASKIGIETRIMHQGNGRYLLPDGSERFLVDEEMLLMLTGKFNGQLVEPIKTTNVQNLRCMTTWCVQKK
jgi:SAM-dependent methyltransferase